MNSTCLNCNHVRTLARVRAGHAQACFHCPKQSVNRVYLMPGKMLKCFELRDGNTLNDDVLKGV